MPPIPRYRSQTGPAIFSTGFRPFFLAAAAWSALAVPLWLAAHLTSIDVPTLLPPAAWHAHEMVYGFAAATVAGFLLTAIPNWTGRIPLQGGPLAPPVVRAQEQVQAQQTCWPLSRMALRAIAVLRGLGSVARDAVGVSVAGLRFPGGRDHSAARRTIAAIMMPGKKYRMSVPSCADAESSVPRRETRKNIRQPSLT